MSNKKQKFYISTALPYVNSPPHIGFALEITQADVTARYHRLLGEDVFFLTGTDENSLKNVQAAKEEGISIKELVDRNAEKFRELKEILNLSSDDFIRTTEERHINGAKRLWFACKKDIYKKKYAGLYCVGCEEFYKENELVNGLCLEHGTKPEFIEEENYFFKLSKYQDKLKKIIETDELRIIPESRKNEILSFINSGLQDFCISRSVERTHGWGIPVPGDSSQYFWVWFDALSNYINALDYTDNSQKFQDFWQGNKNILHCIGKGIIRFHAIYWPAILISSSLNLPKTIFVHGYLTVGGQKMSKTLGNVVNPKEVVERYGTDPLRYFLLREISPIEDGDFSYKKFEERYNADLANGLGNLVSRVLTLGIKVKSKNDPFNFIQGHPERSRTDEKGKTTTKNPKLNETINEAWGAYRNALGNFKFNEALEAVWKLISFADEYISREKPWEKDGEAKSLILNSLFLILGNIVWMLKPFLPETSDKIFKQLGIDPESERPWQEQKFKIKKGPPLFPRL